ncbi:two-component system response regulator [Methylomonas sp. LWB]|uniref:response regulator n=1 Tax=Methylomonas sp. LWB TaxID=1905845 RepID=UPI0008DA7CB9|nr:two-component system response regulator [Methylomonas sp. LWB]OHX34656.1 two-component system response regulator [Methylomonas sp. LWB]
MRSNERLIRPTVLVVDDTPDNLVLISGLLKPYYRVKVAGSGPHGLRIAAGDGPPDLILLDVMMPEMDGYEVCRLLKADVRTAQIPVIFLTAKTEQEAERYGLELGAVDYIAKPVSPPIVLARVKNHLALKAAADFLRDQNAFLENEIRRRIAEVLAIQDATIHVVTALAETRDPETGNHIRRTQFYVKALAEALLSQPRFAGRLNEADVAIFCKSAPLHDIGKVGIPDRILLKRGRLTPDEFEIMKTHPALGREAIERAERQLGMRVGFLDAAKQIAYGHHEKWDGSGYPHGLSGDAIPIPARMMAIADVYDALISRRVYKPPMSHESALATMREQHVGHFDPDMLAEFFRIEAQIREIAECYADTDRGPATNPL